MEKLLIHPSETAQWLSLVHEAQKQSQIQLEEDLESYLVFLLMRFTANTELASSVLGLEFLESQQATGAAKQNQLRDVGDKCLLVSGMFPGRAESRRVKLSYFVHLGQSAYSSLSTHSENNLAKLFSELSLSFIHLRDVLHTIRHLSPESHGMTVWQALELWENTGSLLAKQALDELDPQLAMRIHIKSTL